MCIRPYFRRLISKAFSEASDGESFDEWWEDTERRECELPPLEVTELGIMGVALLTEEEQAEWIANNAVVHWKIFEDECFFEEQELQKEKDAYDMYLENKYHQRMEEI